MERARNLQKTLGFSKWSNFKNNIEKCIQISKYDSRYSFKKTLTSVKIGYGAIRNVLDFELNELDVELLHRVCSSQKPITNFAIKNELYIINQIKKFYNARGIDVIHQYKLDKYVYDCKIGENILFEYDEHYHDTTKQREIDKIKSEAAIALGYNVVRANIGNDMVDILIKIEMELDLWLE